MNSEYSLSTTIRADNLEEVNPSSATPRTISETIIRKTKKVKIFLPLPVVVTVGTEINVTKEYKNEEPYENFNPNMAHPLTQTESLQPPPTSHSNYTGTTVSPVYSSTGDVNAQGRIRTQVLRGADHITGLARHEYRRNGEFTPDDPNFPEGAGRGLTTIGTGTSTSSTNVRTTELDNNVCKAEWIKSMIDWPYPHLFDKFRDGFDDVKYSVVNEEIMRGLKGLALDEEILSEEQWMERAYAEGVKFGRKYMMDRGGGIPSRANLINPSVSLSRDALDRKKEEKKAKKDKKKDNDGAGDGMFDYGRHSRGSQFVGPAGETADGFQQLDVHDKYEEHSKAQCYGKLCCSIL